MHIHPHTNTHTFGGIYIWHKHIHEYKIYNLKYVYFIDSGIK